MSSPPHSREATPSSGDSNDQASASGSSQEPIQEEVDKFLKRMDMEKKMQILQQRLELASVKATHGWADKSITEIERTMSPPPRRRSFKAPAPIRVDPYVHAGPQSYSPDPLSPSASSSRSPYEPPSPSRPWQLIDVLWQPLPPSSHAPPASPRKRTRDTEPFVPSSRRASSSMAYIPERMRKEKRSYSHSTTTQDVDAAKALAFMHGDTVLRPTVSLPIPDTPPSRSRSLARSPPETPRSEPRRRASRDDDEDRSAADLMMFLAHSPSPLRKSARSAMPASPGAARVLFGDAERIGKSNLALAPPITASAEGGFGDLLSR